MGARIRLTLVERIPGWIVFEVLCGPPGFCSVYYHFECFSVPDIYRRRFPPIRFISNCPFLSSCSVIASLDLVTHLENLQFVHLSLSVTQTQ